MTKDLFSIGLLRSRNRLSKGNFCCFRVGFLTDSFTAEDGQLDEVKIDTSKRCKIAKGKENQERLAEEKRLDKNDFNRRVGVIQIHRLYWKSGENRDVFSASQTFTKYQEEFLRKRSWV